eukprot:g11250.t1
MLSQGRNLAAGRSTTTAEAAAAAAAAAVAETGHMRAPSPPRPPSGSGAHAFDHGVAAPRPRRSWDTAFLTTNTSSCSAGGFATDSTTGVSRPRPPRRTASSAAAPAGTTVGGGAATDAGSRPAASIGRPTSCITTEGANHGAGDLTDNTRGGRTGDRGSRGGDATLRDTHGDGGGDVGIDGGASNSSGGMRPGSAAAAVVVARSAASPPPPPPPPYPSSSPAPASSSSSRARGMAGSDEDHDLTDNEEGVMGRLAEFTEMARSIAIQNEELSRALANEKRRAAHTARKLEQSSITCTELRESLALAQDTVIKLREHEMSWAETTASEMSLRAELCAVKDEYSSVAGDASALRKRCDLLQRENAELADRFTTLAEEKRQVESRARRLLRSDRFRGY